MKKHCLNVEKYFVDVVDKKLAKKMIEKNHYTHKWTSCNVSLGIYEKMGDHNFFDTSENKLIGCIVYGYPICNHGSDSISPIITHRQVFELTRLWIADGHGSNIESWFIGQSFKWLRANRPEIKCIISYADPEQGHRGTIYQATNFLFQNTTKKQSSLLVSFTNTPYNWIHSKTIYDRLGTHDIKEWKEKLPKPFWYKTISTKYRYIYPFGNKQETKKILKTLKHPVLPYPKTVDVVESKIEECN